MKTIHSESILQQQCFAWFRRQYPNLALNLVAILNGDQRSKMEAAIMSGEGVVPGVADAVLFVPDQRHHTLCFIFKTTTKTAGRNGKVTEKKTYQSEAQKAWQAAVEKTHNKYVVIRTLDEFIAEIKSYIVKPSCWCQAMGMSSKGIPL